ncbi:pheST operon leader peptide PheM [Yersinia pekkanenii]
MMNTVTFRFFFYFSA